MGFDLAKLRTDKDKSENGVWMNVDPEGVVQLKLARIKNPKFMNFMRDRMLSGKAGKGASKKIAQLMGESAVDEATIVEGIAKFVLLDWKGILEDGKEIPYSQETAERVLADEQYQEFLEIVVEMASDNEAFRAKAIGEVAGN